MKNLVTDAARKVKRTIVRDIGSPPGTINVQPDAQPPVIRIFGYGPEEYVEETISDLAAIKELRRKWPVLWVNVDGLGDADLISQLGDMFDLHRLALEDVVGTHQRAKVEEYDKVLFIVLRMTYVLERLETEQLSLFLGDGFVVTFQEHTGDCLDALRARIRENKGRIRKTKADYLAYSILDAVVDAYFPILEDYGNRLEDMEEWVIKRPDNRSMLKIRSLKRDLLTFRRAVWPLREVVNEMVRDQHSIISKDTRVYLRDCHDHAIQIIDIIETHREMSSGLMDVYMSSVSNRMNEVMKVLTIFAAIFIPLTFIAGIYGMNFNTEISTVNMPELNAEYGYPITLGVMLAIAVTMLVYFWRKGWIGQGRGD